MREIGRFRMRILPIIGGGAGIGKSVLTLNLAVVLARRGRRVLVMDGDAGAGALRDLLDVRGPDLGAVLAADATLDQVLRRHLYGVDLLPMTVGGEPLGAIAPDEIIRLQAPMCGLRGYDYVLVDCCRVPGQSMFALALAAGSVLLATTVAPQPLADGYGLLRTLYLNGFDAPVFLVINQAHTVGIAQHAFEKIRDAARSYLDASLTLLGTLPRDPAVPEAGALHEPVAIRAPVSPVGQALEALGEAVEKACPPGTGEGDMGVFWARFVALLLNPFLVSAVPPSTSGEGAPIPEVLDRLDRIARRLDGLTAPSRPTGEAADAGSAPVMEQRVTGPVAVPRPPGAARLERRNGDRQGRRQQGRRQGFTVRLERRNGDRSAQVRRAPRICHFDGMQLRRLTGQLMTHFVHREQGPVPVPVDVEQVDVPEGNPFRLQPGRYTRIDISCDHLANPRRIIFEVLENSGLVDCAVRQLEDGRLLWLTTRQDGCLVLEDEGEGMRSVQVFLSPGGGVAPATPGPAGSGAETTTAKIATGPAPTTEASPAPERCTFERLLERLVRAPEWDLAEPEPGLYRLSRRDRPPVLVARIEQQA